MPKATASTSASEAERTPFLTIDDCVTQAQVLLDGLKRLSQMKHPLDIRRGIGREVIRHMPEGTPSHQLKASGRTYFFDIEKTVSGRTYLRITESRKGSSDTFERQCIHVFPEDAREFSKVVAAMIAELD